MNKEIMKKGALPTVEHLFSKHWIIIDLAFYLR